MKYVFTLIHILLIAAIGYLCVSLFSKLSAPEDVKLSETSVLTARDKKLNAMPSKRSSIKKQYDNIMSRNIFKVDIDGKKDAQENKHIGQEPEKIEATTLKLELWGTVTGKPEAFAVIEDKQSHKQALYQTGDLIQGAEIKEILRHSVILVYKGKPQVLEMTANQTKNTVARQPDAGTAIDSSSRITINRALFDQVQANPLALRKTIKFRPHMTEGEPDGIMIYGIRPDSAFIKMGLKNGDIIKNINGTKIETGEDTLTLFSHSQDLASAKATVLRRGKLIELIYQLVDGPPMPPDTPDRPN